VATQEDPPSHPSSGAELVCRSIECRETKQHLEEEIAGLRLQLEERPEQVNVIEQCRSCFQTRASEQPLSEALAQEARGSSEGVTFRQESSILEAGQNPAYRELITNNEDLERQLRDHLSVIQRMQEDNINLRRQLEESVQLSAALLDTFQCPRCAELEEAKDILERKVASLMHQVNDEEEVMNIVLGASTVLPPPQPVVQPLPGIITAMDWKSVMRAPDQITSKNSSSAFSNANFEMYCCSSGKLIYSFNVITNTWRELPRLQPPGDTQIVFHRDVNLLMPVKERHIYYIINNGQWCKCGVDRLSLMLGASELSLVPWMILSHNKHLLVFGAGGKLRLVHISGSIITELNTSWIISPTFVHASAVINNDAVYLLGATTSKQFTRNVYKLPLNDIMQNTGAAWYNIFKSRTANWQEIAPLPVSRCLQRSPFGRWWERYRTT
jgi:hypothetical protein